MLKNIKIRPLDNFEIKSYFPNAKIIAYKEIEKLNNIDQLFLRSNICFLLIENAENIGHWVCLLKFADCYEYFDSMGGKPDIFKWLSKEQIKENNNNFPYLTLLLQKTKKPVIYNDYQLQKVDTATCGRWCILRGYTAFKMGLNYDAFIGTMKRLKKQTGADYDDISAILINKLNKHNL